MKCTFLKIGDINTPNQNFEAEILVQAKWEEPALDETEKVDCSIVIVKICFVKTLPDQCGCQIFVHGRHATPISSEIYFYLYFSKCRIPHSRNILLIAYKKIKKGVFQYLFPCFITLFIIYVFLGVFSIILMYLFNIVVNFKLTRIIY